MCPHLAHVPNVPTALYHAGHTLSPFKELVNRTNNENESHSFKGPKIVSPRFRSGLCQPPPPPKQWKLEPDDLLGTSTIMTNLQINLGRTPGLLQ